MTALNVTAAVAVSDAAPSLFNKAQTVLLENYENGEFKYLLAHTNPVTMAQELNLCGDGLLKYLMSELAASEDCDSVEEAISRVDTSITQLEKLHTSLLAL
jgi:hypothetical protein